MRAEPSTTKEPILDDLLRARGLLRVPFSPDAKSAGTFATSAHREVSTQLDTTAALRGVMALTGSPGTGKSTLL